MAKAEVLALICFVAFVLVVVGTSLATVNWRMDQRRRDCFQDHRQWSAIHDVIEETGEPTINDSQETKLPVIIPPLGEEPIIVRIQPTDSPPPDLSRFYARLGPEPQC